MTLDVQKRIQQNDRSWALAGFCGHGFKFGAVIGERRRSPSYSSGDCLGRRQG
jgi:hypothetical protein